MTQTVNQIVLSGTVFKLFEARETQAGLKNRSFLINFTENDRERRMYVNAFGNLVDQMEDLEEGSYVIVQGRVTEQAWQDKESEEWKHRVEIIPNRIVDLGELDGPPDE